MLQLLVHEINLSQTNARYAAYSAAFARGFRYLMSDGRLYADLFPGHFHFMQLLIFCIAIATRYLAFTSDFGEALRPVVAQRVVTVGTQVSISYMHISISHTCS